MARDSVDAGAAHPRPLARLFVLLSDVTRLRILELLGRGERNVSSICLDLGVPQPTVSYHLGLLQRRKLVAGSRSGREVVYRVVDGPESDGPTLKVTADGYVISVEIARPESRAESGGRRPSAPPVPLEGGSGSERGSPRGDVG